MQLVEIGFELGVGEPVDDAAILHHVVAIRNRRSEAKILLDQEDGDPKAVDAAQKTITYAIGGLIVILLSFLVLVLIGNITGVKTITEFNLMLK